MFAASFRLLLVMITLGFAGVASAATVTLGGVVHTADGLDDVGPLDLLLLNIDQPDTAIDLAPDADKGLYEGTPGLDTITGYFYAIVDALDNSVIDDPRHRFRCESLLIFVLDDFVSEGEVSDVYFFEGSDCSFEADPRPIFSVSGGLVDLSATALSDDQLPPDGPGPPFASGAGGGHFEMLGCCPLVDLQVSALQLTPRLVPEPPRSWSAVAMLALTLSIARRRGGSPEH
jgi:hypothetical protein